MLRISKKADYAVFLMGTIARQGAYPGGPASGTVVSAQEISKQAGLNKSVVANLLKELAKHGLLESTRGLRGGYRLSRIPRDISLAEILVVFEGPFELVGCTGHVHGTHSPLLALAPSMQASDGSGDCSLMAFCPSKRPMRVVQDRIAKLFADIRLDELCALSPATATPGRALVSQR
jgi:Rrf2 family protein